MFAAMNPSGPAACIAHGQPSQLPNVVAVPVHGRLFHSQLSRSWSHASTSAARVKQRTSSAWTAAFAHSSSSIKSSLASLSMRSLSQPANRGFKWGCHEIY